MKIQNEKFSMNLEGFDYFATKATVIFSTLCKHFNFNFANTKFYVFLNLPEQFCFQNHICPSSSDRNPSLLQEAVLWFSYMFCTPSGPVVRIMRKSAFVGKKVITLTIVDYEEPTESIKPQNTRPFDWFWI